MADCGTLRTVNAGGQYTNSYYHNGVDIGMAPGANVLAANNGKVVFAGELTLTGNTVIIDHGCSLLSYYGHLGSISVKEGDILFTYETDKASFECESTAEGELLEIFYGEGDEVPCLINVCAIGTKGEDCSALKGAGAAPTAEAAAPAAAPVAGEAVTAPMPGNILKVAVSAGQSVKEGDLLVVLEAMKMENEIFAPKSGTVAQVLVQKGSTVDTGATMVVLN